MSALAKPRESDEPTSMRVLDQAMETVAETLKRADRKLGPRARRVERALAGEDPGDFENEDTTRRTLPDINAIPRPA